MGIEWYRNEMPISYEDQITIEKSPQYFVRDQAPYRIFKYNSTICLILIVKEPVERTLSEYAHHKLNWEPGIKKGELIPFEKEVFNSSGGVNTQNVNVYKSIYWPYLQHYLEFFQRDQILVVDGDEFVQYPLPVIQKVEKF
ncbi:unnamed protein product, partial [Meganyctiphanes norvegica]